MTEADIAELKAAVERSHRCPATYRTSERVRDQQQQQVEVALFDILGHPRALVCYAWFSPSHPGGRHPHTVLREGPIHSSLDAVHSELDE
jgi:hypothetical protein